MSSRDIDKAQAEAGLLRVSTAGRGGPVWKRLVRDMLARSTVCAICGHDGADTGDHILSRREYPHLAEDPTNVQPAHGVNGCPTCGRRCNQDKKTEDDRLLTSEDWFA